MDGYSRGRERSKERGRTVLDDGCGVAAPASFHSEGFSRMEAFLNLFFSPSERQFGLYQELLIINICVCVCGRCWPTSLSLPP